MEKDLTVIIPVFNEELNLETLYSRLKKVTNLLEVSYEFIFINDGSRDRSLDIIVQLTKSDASVKFINLSRNFGHQVAVSAGIDKAKGKAVVIIDADLQDPPELIYELYKKYKDGYHVVYAKRKIRKGENFLKKFTAKVFYRLMGIITNISIPLDIGDFRIIDKKVVDVLRQMPEQQKFLRGQISWIGFRQTAIEYDRDERNAGKTGYTYRKMIHFAFDGITSFSNFPLRFATIAGFIVSGFAFLFMLYALYARFIAKSFVWGWTSLVLSTMFIGGIQLIGIGIIGEYISRISDNVRKRPLYIVDETNTE